MTGVPAEFSSAHEYVTKLIQHKGRYVDLPAYLRAYPHEFLRGILVAGSIGSGKTQWGMRIVRAAVESGFGVLVFDPSTDYQRLCNVIPDAVVIDICEYYQNPLEPPPGLTLAEWFPIFIQVFAQNFGLKDPSISILQKAAKGLLDKYRERPDEVPLLRELLEEVTAYEPMQRSQETSSHASVLNRLEMVLTSEFGRCLNVRHGFQPTDFESGLLVVQLHALGIERVHELVVGLTIAKLYAYRSQMQRAGQQVPRSVFIVLEEAHRFLSEKRQGDRLGQRMYVERALVECRKLGIGFMVVDQLPHQVSSHVLSSCNMWIVCRLIDAAARKLVGQVLCLDEIWSRAGLMELPVGAAFVRVERMTELEDASPVVAPVPKPGFKTGVAFLPALVAAPLPAEQLLEPLKDVRVESLMVQNGRYLRFFERNVQQDIERVRESVPARTRVALNALLKRTIETDKPTEGSLLSYYGLTDDVSGSKHSTYQTGSVHLNRQQIDELTRYLRLLSSRPCVRVLQSLKNEGSMDSLVLCKKAQLSPGRLSRVVTQLAKEELVERVGKGQRTPAQYRATARGSGVMRWAESLSDTRSEPLDATGIDVPTEDADWLLESVRSARGVREKVSIAGWNGGEKVQEENAVAELLLTYVVQKTVSKRGPEVPPSIDAGLVKDLATGMHSGLIPLLLTDNSVVSVGEVVEELGLVNSSARKLIARLEKRGLVERERKMGQTFINLASAWKEALTHPYVKPYNTIRIGQGLLARASRVVLDSELVRIMIDSSVGRDGFEIALQRCLKLAG